ncbi:MAG: VanZ family protein [Oscillospiraceae bacterium]|nr:VanZ family protein [Oscillospiraceae bacterium]
MKKAFTIIATTTAIIYIYCLFVLLFRGFYGIKMMVSEDLIAFRGCNLIPFKTIAEFIENYIDGSLRGIAFRNLTGNLFLLVPLGFYLPFFAKKLSELKFYMLVVAVFIIAVEVVQFLTYSGILDIDDFILNFAGALIGFIVFTHTAARRLFELRAW